jgi:hypothetical protein
MMLSNRASEPTAWMQSVRGNDGTFLLSLLSLYEFDLRHFRIEIFVSVLGDPYAAISILKVDWRGLVLLH